MTSARVHIHRKLGVRRGADVSPSMRVQRDFVA
jgi:hypothetical protein